MKNKFSEILKWFRIGSLSLLLVSLLFVFMTFLTGCGASKPARAKKHVKKAKKHLNRAKELFPDVVITDTIVIHDTITIEKHDTITKTQFIVQDSVTVINNERVRLRYIYDTITNEIHHDVICKEIVKPIETRVEVEQIREPTDMEIFKAEWKNYLILLIAIVILIVILRK